eukprot:TRINITY_DN914_c0_g1_i1.p1 TRINITY_DN914_c0_g1~~TRINITY_DN914_c0_g1_i1.p1  ORF type:complete len:483 (-),score=90.12 TRINITY_DN914_c0_g1_i1:44-1492(-)
MEASGAKFDGEKAKAFVHDKWDAEVVPQLSSFISIPNQSPLYDEFWATNGYQEKAVDLLTAWANKQEIVGFKLEVITLEGRTPVIFMEIPARGVTNLEDTVLLYGHLDKQPPLTEAWDEGLGPYKPVIRDGKLYGRGGADDGYAIFAALTSIRALQLQNVPHARCVVLIEACEESGSRDLPTYITHLKDRIQIPSLIVCLDSGCGNYDQFWMTTSLRGLVTADLKVQVLREAVHSGAASGIVPSSFRILRGLLDRIEDVDTGNILIPETFVEISENVRRATQQTAEVLGATVHEEMPWAGNMSPVTSDITELLLNKSWRPALALTGIDGIPNIKVAGNVLRTSTTVKLSLRLPPGVNPQSAGSALKAALERDPPYGADVTCTLEKAAPGWASPELVPWLEESVNRASQQFFQKEARSIGEGGSIPFMGMLGELYPKAQFVITGVLGPKSNAHGPNEFIDILMGKRVTCCVSSILADHATHLL